MDIPESCSWQVLDYDHDNKIISIGVEDFDDIISNLETLEDYLEDPEILDNVSDESPTFTCSLKHNISLYQYIMNEDERPWFIR